MLEECLLEECHKGMRKDLKMDKKRIAVLGSSGSIGAKAVMLIDHVNKVGSQMGEGHEA